MVRVLQLKQQLQTIKKGSMFISDYIMKIKAIEDALETAGHTITDADLVLSMLSGLGHEYDPMVVLVSHQSKTMNLQDVEYLLMLHEQRIEQLNTSSQIEANVASANFASNSDGGKNQRGGGIQSRGNNRGRGRGNKGGKWNNQKLQCQLCQKPGHSALQCYKSIQSPCFKYVVPALHSTFNKTVVHKTKFDVAIAAKTNSALWHAKLGHPSLIVL
ncbi:hypothetical protein ACOSP7_013631 [Xanthoceras sorbifolium]